VLALAHLGFGLGLVPRLVLENGPFAAGLVLYAASEELGDYDIGFVWREAPADARQARPGTAIGEILARAYGGATPA
jgi:LysR family positive regulator for ilvC